MLIEDYLKGKVGMDVPDSAISVILDDRGLREGTDTAELDKRTKELCTADLYLWCAATPSKKGTVSDADGGWKHSDGGCETSAYDKRNFRELAYSIYNRYGEKPPQESTAADFKIKYL